MKKTQAVVIIPVYNAFSEALDCIKSVLSFTSAEVLIHVLDDASPQGDFESYLASLAENKQLKIERNQSNLGFVATCNKAMQAAGQADVVLLNSDTLVTKGWLEKLQLAAYSSQDIGTVTPFTNNGIICSIPRFCQDNQLPGQLSLERFADLIEKASQRTYPTLPTCVGFCVYIKRSLLDAVGLFDAQAFGRGYGEENDLSQRGQKAGFKDILDDSTFVYHKGCCSFADLHNELTKENTEIIRQRYPHYFDNVSKFCSDNPLRPTQERVLDALVEEWNSNKPRSLHIVHNGPHVSRGDPLGGTELHVQDLINNIEGVAHWSLVPSKRCYYLTAHIPGAEREYILDLSKTSLKKLINADFFDLVHLHHSRWLDHSELCEALAEYGKHVVSFHDYTLVCPRFHLYTPFRKHCNGFECQSQCGYQMDYIEKCRSETTRALESAKKVFCFSDSTKSLVTKILKKDFNWRKIPHGLSGKQSEIVQRAAGWSEIKPFKIAFIGFVPQHKGSLIIEQLVKNRCIADIPVEWHVFGKLFLDVGDKIIDHGEYRRGELPDKLRTIKPDLVLILSICPETYSFTLDEAWAAGAPVLSTPLGAPPERIRESGAGWVLKDLKVETVLDHLGKIIKDKTDYNEKMASIERTEIISPAREGQLYWETYKEIFEESKSSLKALQFYLAEFGLGRPPAMPLVWRVLGKLLNVVIYWLDSFQIRGFVQRAALRLLPHSAIINLKSGR